MLIASCQLLVFNKEIIIRKHYVKPEMLLIFILKVRVRLTSNFQCQAVTWTIRVEADLKSTGRKEWLKYVAHYVDLSVFISLMFPPDNWIVKHIKLFRVELAVDFKELAIIEDEDLVFSQYLYIREGTADHRIYHMITINI